MGELSLAENKEEKEEGILERELEIAREEIRHFTDLNQQLNLRIQHLSTTTNPQPDPSSFPPTLSPLNHSHSLSKHLHYASSRSLLKSHLPHDPSLSHFERPLLLCNDLNNDAPDWDEKMGSTT